MSCRNTTTAGAAIIVSAFALFGITAHANASSSKPHLYRERIEIYWNDWSGKKITGTSKGQVDILISGEGKTVAFTGVMSTNCLNLKHYWKTASNYGNPNKAENAVPLQALNAAMRLFCK